MGGPVRGRREREAEHRLQEEIERAVSEVLRVAEALRELAGGLPFGMRRMRPHFESLAARLEVVAAGLSTELRGEVDGESVGLLSTYAKRALVGVAALTVWLGTGAAEGIGSEVAKKVLQSHQIEERLAGVEAALGSVPPATGLVEDAVGSADQESARPRGPFPARMAAELAGISFRQLDYWTRTGLVEAVAAGDEGDLPPSARRSYSYDAVLRAKVVKTLLEAGIKLEAIRSAMEVLPAISDGDQLVLGHEALLVAEAELGEYLRSSDPGIVSIVSVGHLRAELDADVAAAGGAG